MTAPARVFIRSWPNDALSVYEEPTEGALPYVRERAEAPTYDALAMALAGIRAVSGREGCTECCVVYDTADRALVLAGYPADGPWKTTSGAPIGFVPDDVWNGPAMTDPVEPMGRLAGVCAAPIIQEGATTWVGTSKTPDCTTCMDRGRVWDGEDGETKPCSACAVWSVWSVPVSDDPEVVRIVGTKAVRMSPGERMTRRRAEAVVSERARDATEEEALGRAVYWRAEVRPLPKETP